MTEYRHKPNKCCKTIVEAWQCEGCCPDEPLYSMLWDEMERCGKPIYVCRSCGSAYNENPHRCTYLIGASV